MWARLSLVKPVCHVRTPGAVLASVLPCQLPANIPGMAAEDGPNTWNTAKHMGSHMGAPGSWLQPCPELAAAPARKMNQKWNSSLPFFLPHFPIHYLS